MTASFVVSRFIKNYHFCSLLAVRARSKQCSLVAFYVMCLFSLDSFFSFFSLPLLFPTCFILLYYYFFLCKSLSLISFFTSIPSLFSYSHEIISFLGFFFYFSSFFHFVLFHTCQKSFGWRL